MFLFDFVEQERIEIKKLHQGDNLILGFSIGGGIDQDPAQNPFSQDKGDKVSVVCLPCSSLYSASASHCVELKIIRADFNLQSPWPTKHKAWFHFVLVSV